MRAPFMFPRASATCSAVFSSNSLSSSSLRSAGARARRARWTAYEPDALVPTAASPAEREAREVWLTTAASSRAAVDRVRHHPTRAPTTSATTPSFRRRRMGRSGGRRLVRQRRVEDAGQALAQVTGTDPPELEAVPMGGHVGQHGAQHAGGRHRVDGVTALLYPPLGLDDLSQRLGD